jgi:hypothetical protein
MRFLSWLNQKLGIIVDDPMPGPSRLDELDGMAACMLCPRFALQDGLCREHGGLPFAEWPAEAQARLLSALRGDES